MVIIIPEPDEACCEKSHRRTVRYSQIEGPSQAVYTCYRAPPLRHGADPLARRGAQARGYTTIAIAPLAARRGGGPRPATHASELPPFEPILATREGLRPLPNLPPTPSSPRLSSPTTVQVTLTGSLVPIPSSWSGIGKGIYLKSLRGSDRVDASDEPGYSELTGKPRDGTGPGAGQVDDVSGSPASLRGAIFRSLGWRGEFHVDTITRRFRPSVALGSCVRGGRISRGAIPRGPIV